MIISHNLAFIDLEPFNLKLCVLSFEILRESLVRVQVTMSSTLLRCLELTYLMNLFSSNSRKASCNSSRVFITIGPPQAMDSRSGSPAIRKNRIP